MMYIKKNQLLIMNIIFIKDEVFYKYTSTMNLIIQTYKNHSQYNFLLFLSLFVVLLSFYFLFKNYSYVSIAPITKTIVTEKIISISMISPEPIVDKKVKEVKTKTVKKQIVKKKTIKKKIAIQKKEIVQKEKIIDKVAKTKLKKISHEVSKAKLTPKPAVKTFDAKMKASFMAGLYKKINKEKYYPKMAKRRNLKGVASISFTLHKDGRIKNVFLSKSCGHKILDKAALKIINSIGFYKSIPDAVSMTALNINIPIKYTRG